MAGETRPRSTGTKIIMVIDPSGNSIEVAGGVGGEIKVILCGIHNNTVTPLQCTSDGKLITSSS